MNNSYNPTGITNIGDPYVLRASDGYYYMYATTFAPVEKVNGFNVYKSKDLRSWSKPLQCYAENNRSFGYCDFWAPEVYEINNKFYMFYSSRSKSINSLRIGLAVADNPIGKFIDVFDNAPLFDFGYAAIDAHLFTDDNGKKYLFFSRDCSENIVNGIHESHIYVADINDNLEQVSNPRFIMRAEKDYELTYKGDFTWNEGPFVVKREGYYYLFYSANFFASKEYCTCYAVSKDVDKGYTKADKPLISYVLNKVSGPGHNCIVKDINGDLLCVYHVHTYYDTPSENRQMFIDKIFLDNGKASVEGPTLKEL